MADAVIPTQPGAPDGPGVLVVGAAGFAGAIAARLLWRHPTLRLTAVTARSEAGRRLDEVYPHHRVPLAMEELDLERHATEGEPVAAIVGYPHGASSETVAALHERGLLVVDLSADFRLNDPAVYRDWYGDVHAAPHLFGSAVYGLPELHRDDLRAVAGAGRLVAAPGCYPTATLLALAPLARAGLLEDVVIDAKSGVSGAGRGLSRSTHFTSVAENVHAYKVEGHRHQPEIREQLALLQDGAAPVREPLFVPHLLPLDQGELVSCYVRPTREVDADEVAHLFAAAYADEPFVEVSGDDPGVRDVRETNVCRIRTHVDARSGHVLAFSAIDNLWKGTASQAVQALNLALGRPETEGIPT